MESESKRKGDESKIRKIMEGKRESVGAYACKGVTPCAKRNLNAIRRFRLIR